MSYLDYKATHEAFKEQVLKGIQSHFPAEGVKGRARTLKLQRLEVDDSKHQPDDVRAQHEAKIQDGSFAAPIYGHFELTDHDTGKTVQQRVKVADLPVLTNRHSYVVGGQEWNVTSQWQLKPGVYTRRRQNGELETRFNVVGNRAFDLKFDPEKKLFTMERGTSKHINAYPIMRALGVPDSEMEKLWGKEILEANQTHKSNEQALDKFYKADTKRFPQDQKEALEYLHKTMQESSLNPDATKATLGVAYSHVEPGSLLHATRRMLDVQNGAPEDKRDSLLFKQLRDVSDYVGDKLSAWKNKQMIQSKIRRQLDKPFKDAGQVAPRDIIRSDIFNPHVKGAITDSKNLSEVSRQINPVDMVSAALRTSIMGPGGIQSDQQVMDEAKMIDASHFGFVDPVDTPEGCFDAATEVLTSEGWLPWPEVSADTLFACRILGQVEYCRATELQKYSFRGQMYGLRARGVEYLVTSNHRIWCGPSQEVDNFRIERADAVHGRRRFFLTERGVELVPAVRVEAELEDGYYMQHYRGQVYCATVPGSLLYVRRPGKLALWMGNSKVGITLNLPIGVKKSGKVPNVPVYNLKTHKYERLPPAAFLSSVVVMPDQITWKDGKPTPNSSKVRVMGSGNEIREVPYASADYTMVHPSQVFSLTNNLMPFLNNNSGNRVNYAGHHITQSISLVGREAPLVQTGTGSSHEDASSFEKVMGRHTSHISPIDGVVTAVNKDGIILKGKDGKRREVQLYNHFPLNDSKSTLHSSPIVKVGDTVKKDQHLADTNFTRNGTLALGRTLTVGYVPMRGYNFEDSVVMSETAAKKMTSLHLHKPEVKLNEHDIVDPKRFVIHQTGAFTTKQLEGIGSDGAVRVGQKVQPGDPLVLVLKPPGLNDRSGAAKVRKNLANIHGDGSLRWSSDFPGTVVAVNRTRDGRISVHVKTEEPMQVGDKMCFDGATEVLTSSGWKSVQSVTLEDEVCTLEGEEVVYRRPSEVHRYKSGGRMYRIKSQQVDLAVTAEHRMYVQKRGSDHFELLPASQIAGKRVSYKKNGTWRGSEPATFTFPSYEARAGQGGVVTRTVAGPTVPLRVYLALLGAYLTNGHTSSTPSNGDFCIGIDKKRGGLKELQRVLESAGIHTRVSQSKESLCDRLTINSKSLFTYFKQFGHAPDKHIPPEVFGYTQESLKVLFKWLMWGDGHSTGARPVSYCTVSTRLADDVQRLALHVGYAANINKRLEEGMRRIFDHDAWCLAVYDVRMVVTKLTPTVNHGHVKTQKVQEEYFYDSDEPVYCVTVPSHVLYVRRNGKSVWSGNSTRSGAKGVVGLILPDHEMPRTKNGPLDVALSPYASPGRMNMGHLLEVAAGKIAQKTGKPYIVNNFSGGDTLSRIRDELKAHGLSDTEEVTDPKTGIVLGHTLVGPQHILKLQHQSEKKVSARAGMTLHGDEPESYDINLVPTSGGHAGGQSFGNLGMNALLSHGARAIIREAQTIKSEGIESNTPEHKEWKSLHKEVWNNIQMGLPLPTPKPTFAFSKFISMLNAAGVNVEKTGSKMQLSPLTNAEVLKMSRGELTKPVELTYARVDKDGNLKTIKGGLFDEHITGGIGGKNWSHITLAEPLPNPVFEKAIQKVLGLSSKAYTHVVTGNWSVDAKTGTIHENHSGNLSGGPAIHHLLSRIDVARDLRAAKADLDKVKVDTGLPFKDNTQKLDTLVKKVKYLGLLEQKKIRPEDAYVLKHLPVLPPAMRPPGLMEDGSVRWDDMNKLYKSFSENNQVLKKHVDTGSFGHDAMKRLRFNQYDGLQAIMGTAESTNKDLTDKSGLLKQISGGSPKEGFFQKTLLSRRQDMSMRGVVVPEPSMGIDEVGLPGHKALKLMQPFVIRKLVQLGHAPSALEAWPILEKKDAHKDPRVIKALDQVLAERPVLMKRDPALHKHSVQAFFAKRVAGNSIAIHPLITSAFNADFDGNCYVGSTTVRLQIDLECASLQLDEATSLLQEKYGMHFAGHEKVYLLDGKAIVETRLDQVPYIKSSGMKDKNGADVYNVLPNMQVWSYDHSSAQGLFTPVTMLTIEEGCESSKVETRGGFTLEASSNESLCVYDHATGEVVDCSPVGAEGKLCPVVRGFSAQEGAVQEQEALLGWFYGAYASDGSICSERSINYSKVSAEHRAKFERGLQLATPRYIPSLYREVHVGGAIEGESVGLHFTLPKNVVAGIRSNFYAEEGPEGRPSLRKKLPDISSASWSTLLGILAGLLDGDGTMSVQTPKGHVPVVNVTYCTSSPALVLAVQDLCVRLGIRTGVTPTHPSPGRVQKHTSYNVTLSVVDMRRYTNHLRPLLCTPGYAAVLDYMDNNPVSRDDRDVVPVPAALMALVGSARGPMRGTVAQRGWATFRSSRKRGYYVTRLKALELLPVLREKLTAEQLASTGFYKWEALVEATDVQWDIVERVAPIGKQRVYDLVVPATKVFAVNGGLVVWDTMSVYVPLTNEAVEEAKGMVPSKNIYNPGSGNVEARPSQDAALGLLKMTLVGKDSGKKFAHPAEAIKAVQKGELKADHVFDLTGVGKTTANRVMLTTALPGHMHTRVLTDHGYQLDKKNAAELYTDLAKDKNTFARHATDAMRLGYDAANGIIHLRNPSITSHQLFKAMDGKSPDIQHVPVGISELSLSHFQADKATRDPIIRETQAKVDVLNARNVTQALKDEGAVRLWGAADKRIQDEHYAKADRRSTLFQMIQSGGKPSMSQYKQLILAPMMFEDVSGKTIPVPVTKTYGEGLDMAGYWLSASGARKGSVLKTQEVREPGYFSKQLVNSAMHIVVNGADCGTSKGTALHIGDKGILDRELAQDLHIKGQTFKKGTRISSDVKGAIGALDGNAQVLVRSPLKCSHGEGLCQRCAGLSPDGQHHALGTNLGVIAAQSLGERSTQLVLKAFHSGGAAGTGSGVVGAFDRVQQLTMLPKSIPDAARLAMTTGKVEKVESDSTGTNIWVAGIKHHVPKDRAGRHLNEAIDTSPSTWKPPVVGMHMEAGQHLSDPSRTVVNPHDLYKATRDMNRVQNYLTDELHAIYGKEGIRRQHVETLVRAMGDLTRIRDTGDSHLHDHHYVKGDFASAVKVRAINTELQKKGMKPIEHSPILKGVDVLPLMLHDDWMAKLNFQRLRETIATGASSGSVSDVHGLHPIPGMATGNEYGLTSAHAARLPGRGLEKVPHWGH